MYWKSYLFTSKRSFLSSWLFHQLIHNRLWIFILSWSRCFIDNLLLDTNFFCKSSGKLLWFKIIKFKIINVIFSRSYCVWFMNRKSITKGSKEGIWILFDIKIRLLMNVVLSRTRNTFWFRIGWNLNFSLLFPLSFNKYRCNHRFCSSVLLQSLRSIIHSFYFRNKHWRSFEFVSWKCCHFINVVLSRSNWVVWHSIKISCCFGFTKINDTLLRLYKGVLHIVISRANLFIFFPWKNLFLRRVWKKLFSHLFIHISICSLLVRNWRRTW